MRQFCSCVSRLSDLKNGRKDSLILLFFFPPCYFYLAQSEHSPVLSECSGVALLSDRQPKQDRFTSGPPAHCPVQLTNARRKYRLHAAGTKELPYRFLYSSIVMVFSFIDLHLGVSGSCFPTASFSAGPHKAERNRGASEGARPGGGVQVVVR